MTALPGPVTKVNFDDSSSDDPKLAFAEFAANVDLMVQQRDYLLGLFGATGDKAQSRAEFGLKALATKDTVGEAEIGPRAVTLAKMALGTPGALYCTNENGEPVLVPPGAAGQILHTPGPNEVPIWVDPPATGIKVYESSFYEFGSLGGERVLNLTGYFEDSSSLSLKIRMKVDDGTPITVDGNGDVVIPSVTDLGYGWSDGVTLFPTDGNGGRGFMVHSLTKYQAHVYLPTSTPYLRRENTGSTSTINISKWRYQIVVTGF